MPATAADTPAALLARLPAALAEPDAIPDRSPTPHPWAPMSDAEWAALRPYLHDPSTGGRPADRRRAWDAVFWVAASREPWRALPDRLGRPGTAHRTLSRAACAGILDRLLVALVAGRPGHDPALLPLAWRILRCIRRRARRTSLLILLLVKQLGFHAALPVRPAAMPRPGLSKFFIPLFRHHAAHPDPALLALLRRLVLAMRGAPLRRWSTR